MPSCVTARYETLTFSSQERKPSSRIPPLVVCIKIDCFKFEITPVLTFEKKNEVFPLIILKTNVVIPIGCSIPLPLPSIGDSTLCMKLYMYWPSAFSPAKVAVEISVSSFTGAGNSEESIKLKLKCVDKDLSHLPFVSEYILQPIPQVKLSCKKCA